MCIHLQIVVGVKKSAVVRSPPAAVIPARVLIPSGAVARQLGLVHYAIFRRPKAVVSALSILPKERLQQRNCIMEDLCSFVFLSPVAVSLSHAAYFFL